MHSITLDAAIRAAWSLHLADALPDMPGIYTVRLRDVDAMSPWLRLALGEEAARDLEVRHRAGWSIESMLGINGSDRMHEPVLQARPEEVHAICAIDRLCSEASANPLHSFLHWLAPGTETSSANAFLAPFRAAVDASVETWSSPLSQWREAILRAAADHAGTVLGDEPADLSAWKVREVDATIVRIVAEDRAPNGYVRRPSHAVLECGDGVVRELDDLRGTQRSDSHLYPYGAHQGMRLRLTFRGATSGHGGYLTAVRDVAMMESMESIRLYLASHAEASRIVAEHRALVAAGCPDAQGRLIAVGDSVRLVRGCLEASQGAEGRVVELCGEVVLVDFGHLVGQVPCYPQALSVMKIA